MTPFYGCHVVDGAHQVFVTPDGIAKTDIGPRHPKPRTAIRFIQNLSDGMPLTSPIRKNAQKS